MTPYDIILVLSLLFIKHFIVDFPLQASPYQYLNKGTYGHPGGLIHSGLHGIGTMVCVIWWATLPVALLIALVDAVIHYHVDWAKVNLNKMLGYGPTTHQGFWTLLGLDQLLHALTYIGIVAYLI